ncbi:MAG: C1 family peptidase [Bacteroidota bacterium]|nr:C1 family peptidase [Bacteroidota bacterium]MDP3144933.1 C1 family peptidase [Bacteroidota bacterium]MDP3557054.1 C1 family peptidase [Bacteroidota bacterium]
MKNNLLFTFFLISTLFSAQELTNKKGSEYKFTTIKNLDGTAVQNQNVTGTCWSFSALSFFESEIIRLGKGKEFNLSEMFVARKAYSLKADNFIRMHGKTNFGEGGGFPDVINVLKNYGMVPEEAYTGKKDVKDQHNHKLLETTLINILRPAALPETQEIDFSFLHNSVNAVCDEFLGKAPEKFDFKGKSYTPKTYAEATGLNPNDYVFLTSFTHHPFYSKFVLEVPDNWNWELMHNIPLNELQEVMASAINTGFSFAWAADVSEKGFMFRDGIAIVPETPYSAMTDEEKKSLSIKPVKQLTITQEMRQKAFDNYETQDDHGMHVLGMVKDQNNTNYYYVKNSWGKDNNQCDGYFYASESYVLYKTTSIMIHKKAIPAAIAKKLGITQ